MLYRTVQFQTTLDPESQKELQDLETFKKKLINIHQVLMKEKQKAEQKFQIEKEELICQLDLKNTIIEDLQKNLLDLQKQNEELRDQYEIRLSLTNRLKKQKKFLADMYHAQRQKNQRMLKYLVNENQKLRTMLSGEVQEIRFQERKINLRSNLLDRVQQLNHSKSAYYLGRSKSKEFIQNCLEKRRANYEKSQERQTAPFVQRYRNQPSQDERSVMRDSIIEKDMSSSLMSDYYQKYNENNRKASRVTQGSSGTGNKNYSSQLEKMSAKTNFSREKHFKFEKRS